MGRQYIHYLDQHEPSGSQVMAKRRRDSDDSSERDESSTQNTSQDIYSCRHCGVHFCYHADMVSPDFHGKTGQAYLFAKCLNVFVGPQSEKEMMTGRHIVVDIYCIRCKIIIGWSYVSVLPSRQIFVYCRLRPTRTTKSTKKESLSSRRPTSNGLPEARKAHRE